MKLIAQEGRARQPQHESEAATSSSKLSVEQAASLLLKLGRRILAMSKAYKKVNDLYEKRIDQQSGKTASSTMQGSGP